MWLHIFKLTRFAATDNIYKDHLSQKEVEAESMITESR